MEDSRLHSPWPVSQRVNREFNGKNIPSRRNSVLNKWRNEKSWLIKEMKDRGLFGEIARDEWAGFTLQG